MDTELAQAEDRLEGPPPTLADDASLVLSPEPPPPEPVSFSLSGRRRKPPRALKDYLPHSLVGLPSHLRPVTPVPPNPMPTVVPSPIPSPTPEPEPEPIITTEPNGFGLYRQYTRRPRGDPDEDVTLENLTNTSTRDSDITGTTDKRLFETGSSLFYPFPNSTSYRLVDWFYRASGMKSLADLDALVRNVILARDFDAEDLRTFNASREMARLDTYGATNSPFSAEDGWKEGSVTIRLPNVGSKHASESAAPEFKVDGVYYRSLLEVLKSVCLGPGANKFNWVPYKLFHQSPDARVRVYGDIFTADAMLEEDAKIQALPRSPADDPDTEVALLALMLWSDSTHLASFGTASLWPIYLFFGNISKYTRGKPTTLSAHHLAYIPSVRLDPDAISFNSVLTKCL